jgi:hypothetical protein
VILCGMRKWGWALEVRKTRNCLPIVDSICSLDKYSLSRSIHLKLFNILLIAYWVPHVSTSFWIYGEQFNCSVDHYWQVYKGNNIFSVRSSLYGEVEIFNASQYETNDERSEALTKELNSNKRFRKSFLKRKLNEA